MFEPKYRILLKSKNFPPDKFICLGSQLISIVNFVSPLLPPHIWYGADVEAVGSVIPKHNLDLNGWIINKIGSDNDFIQYCAEIDQFIWGTFLCVDSNLTIKNFQVLK